MAENIKIRVQVAFLSIITLEIQHYTLKYSAED